MMYYIQAEQDNPNDNEVVNMSTLEITGVVLCFGLIVFGLIGAIKTSGGK
jgi:hypothetical protein